VKSAFAIPASVRSGHAVVLGLLLIPTVGCGDSEFVQSVTGSVSYRGDSLTHGIVSFYPPGGRPIGAPIQPDGTYQAKLPPGDYTVAINSPPKLPEGIREGDPMPPPDPNALPTRYAQPNQSGLRVTVSAEGRSQTEDFEL
jgi:hypothetical protein